MNSAYWICSSIIEGIRLETLNGIILENSLISVLDDGQDYKWRCDYLSGDYAE